jgi:preprotein translocase subunit SecE
MGRLQRKKPASKKKAKKAADKASPDKLKVLKGGVSAPARKKPPVPQKAASGKKNLLDKSMQFLREVKVELKKVTWPSRKQTIGSTLVVIILVMIIAVFLGFSDMGLQWLMRVVLN